MAQFVVVPGSAHTGTVALTVTPSGLSCTAELWLATSMTSQTKVVTSGPQTFTSTAASQNVPCPVTMPTAGGTFYANLDVVYGGVKIGTYQGTDTVAVVTVVVGGVTWS